MIFNSSGLTMSELRNDSDSKHTSNVNSIEQLKKMVVLISSGKESYEDLAEQIEDCAYAICKNGNVDTAIQQLMTITSFFEFLENKNEEISRDLADVYILIGQLYQFVENYEESINWFKKASIVDDQYTVSYHNIALSYIKLGEIEGAIRSLVQEVIFSPGNYYSYLILADLYERSRQYSEAELCLKQLLERDPSNIQGLHRMIRYYMAINPEIDVQLLVKKLLSVKKKYTIAESIIRVVYLCYTNKIKDAIDFTSTWMLTTPDEPAVYLLLAFIFNKKSDKEKMAAEIERFKKLYTRRGVEVMRSKVNEFFTIVGDNCPDEFKAALSF